MKKRFAGMLLMTGIMLLFLTWNAQAQNGSTETLTIKGNGVNQEMVFTRAQLEAMTTEITRSVYSAANNFPTDKVMYRQGIPLLYLLRQAGLKDNAQQLTFTSSDGYARTFTCKELLQDQRCYFAPDGSRIKVPAIIAWADSSKGFDSMSDTDLVLTMGQRVKGEQNNPWFVKCLSTIEVSTTPPEQWPKVTFTSSSGPDGITVKLNHSNFDAVKIYYTLDGSNPTIYSHLYNVSASYYQPELNQPVVIKKNTEIRAIAIGAGKNDSETTAAVFNVSSDSYIDLGNYPWAREAIEDLSSRNIIKGMGGGCFAPAEPLTRAQFATMIILALGETPVQGSSPSFSDVKNTDWCYGYVEKAAALGLIKGYPDGTFRPNQVLTRQEMLAVAVQAKGIKVTADSVSPDLLAPFYCETRISDWARGYLAWAEKLKLLEHGHMVTESSKGLTLDALAPTARAEAAVTVYNMLKH
jgi:hypothetical protein